MPSEAEKRRRLSESEALLTLNDNDAFKLLLKRLKEFAKGKMKRISTADVTTDTGPALTAQMGREEMLQQIESEITGANNVLEVDKRRGAKTDRSQQ